MRETVCVRADRCFPFTRNIIEKIRIIGSDHDAQYSFFRSQINGDDFLLFDLSGIFSRSQSINLAEKGYGHDHRSIGGIGFALIF